MLPNRIRIDKQTSEQLKTLKGRTGITPNILCRFAFVRSLEGGTDFSNDNITLDGLDFNLTTLLGDYSSIYDALLVNKYGITAPKQAEMILAMHIHDGIKGLRGVRTLTELCR